MGLDPNFGLHAKHEVDDLGAIDPALADLVLEFEEREALRLRAGRRGTGAEISVTGDELVTGTAGEDLDLVGRAAPGDRGGPTVGLARRRRPGGAERPSAVRCRRLTGSPKLVPSR